MKKNVGLRKRWLRNTVGTIAILGLVFAMLVTGVYGYSCYSRMKDDLRQRAEATTEYFAAHMNQNYEEFYDSCMTYAQTFVDRDDVQLQFLDLSGRVMSSSQTHWVGATVDTPEIQDAKQETQPRVFVGLDGIAGARVAALSSLVTYGNEGIGIFRYVVATEQTDLRILFVGICVLMCLVAMLFVVVMVNSLYIQSVLNPIMDITEKASELPVVPMAYRSKPNTTTRSVSWQTPSMNCLPKSIKMRKCRRSSFPRFLTSCVHR